jgi:sortase A
VVKETMDPKGPSPYATRPRAWTRWSAAFGVVASVALLVATATSTPSPPMAHGVLPRTAAPASTPALATDLLRTVTSPTSSTTTTSTTLPAPPPVENTTLPTPEDVPDPSVREPIGIMGRIAIPSLGLNTELRDQITQESIDLGPSHWPGTAGPGGFGNAVIGGHRSSHSAPFHDLGNLHAGDRIILSNGYGQVFTYSVTASFVVSPEAMWITEQTPGHTLTLFTCHPIGSSAQRLVIRAALV